jgi:hypothetical protein
MHWCPGQDGTISTARTRGAGKTVDDELWTEAGRKQPLICRVGSKHRVFFWTGFVTFLQPNSWIGQFISSMTVEKSVAV